MELNSRFKAVQRVPFESMPLSLGDTTSQAAPRRWLQPRSTHTALFGCSQPSSASGAALSSTDPAGSCTGSVPIATATKKSALRSQISRFPASTRQVPPSFGPKTSFFHSSRRSSSALVTSASDGLRVLLLEFDRVRAPALGLRQPRH